MASSRKDVRLASIQTDGRAVKSTLPSNNLLLLLCRVVFVLDTTPPFPVPFVVSSLTVSVLARHCRYNLFRRFDSRSANDRANSNTCGAHGSGPSFGLLRRLCCLSVAVHLPIATRARWAPSGDIGKLLLDKYSRTSSSIPSSSVVCGCFRLLDDRFCCCCCCCCCCYGALSKPRCPSREPQSSHA